MKYNVKTLRDAGLQAKWTKTRLGAPIIAARKPGTRGWFLVYRDMWKDMNAEGVVSAFERFTLLGDIFYIAE
jgi:hypothetical protein